MQLVASRICLCTDIDISIINKINGKIKSTNDFAIDFWNDNIDVNCYDHVHLNKFYKKN